MLIALDSDGQPKAIGSGFFVGENGEIASNFHVVEDAGSAVVKLMGSDKRLPVLEVLRADAEADLVVLKVNEKSVPVRFHPQSKSGRRGVFPIN
jgi:S1-C subfamily serine protease